MPTCPRCRRSLCLCDVVASRFDMADAASIVLVVVGLVAGLAAVFIP